ncbi:MAG: hypothetical protein E3J66_05535, partial [Dehalococcoidia bacterium]
MNHTKLPWEPKEAGDISKVAKPVGEVFTCPICGAAVKSEAALAGHVERHAREEARKQEKEVARKAAEEARRAEGEEIAPSWWDTVFGSAESAVKGGVATAQRGLGKTPEELAEEERRRLEEERRKKPPEVPEWQRKVDEDLAALQAQYPQYQAVDPYAAIRDPITGVPTLHITSEDQYLAGIKKLTARLESVDKLDLTGRFASPLYLEPQDTSRMSPQERRIYRHSLMETYRNLLHKERDARAGKLPEGWTVSVQEPDMEVLRNLSGQDLREMSPALRRDYLRDLKGAYGWDVEFDYDEFGYLKLEPLASSYVINYTTPNGWVIGDEQIVDPQGHSYTLEEARDIPGVVERLQDEISETDRRELTKFAESKPEEFLDRMRQVGYTPVALAMLRKMGMDTVMISSVLPVEERVGGPAAEGVGEESWQKNTWEAFQLGARQMGHRSTQYFVSTLPNLIWGEAKDVTLIDPTPKPGQVGKGMALSPEDAARINAHNREMRDKFREIYTLNQGKHEEWLEAHPELQPKAEYKLDVTENLYLLKDPGYWAYIIADAASFSLAVLGTTLGVGFATRNPYLAIAAGTAVATPAQSQELYEDLLASGAPESQAADMAVPVGMLIALVEAVTDLPLLKAISPVFNILKRNMQQAVVKATVRQLVKKGAKTFGTIEVVETMEEVVQGAIHNAAIKTFDKNRELFENVDETVIKTLIATLPFAIFGGGAMAHQVNANVDKFQGEGLTPEQARMEAYSEAARTEEGAKAIEDAVAKIEQGVALPKAGVAPRAAEGVVREQMTIDAFKETLPRVIKETKEEATATRKWLARQRGMPKGTEVRDERLIAEEAARVEALKDRLPTLEEMEKNPDQYFPRLKADFPNIYNLLLDRGREMKIVPTEYMMRKAAEAGVAAPKAVEGMPEAGFQLGLTGTEGRMVTPAGKSKIVQIGMDDQLRLDEAKQMAEDARESQALPEARIAEIETLQTDLASLKDEAGRLAQEASGVTEVIQNDPVARYRGQYGKQRRSLMSLLDEYGQFPETLTKGEARIVLMGRQLKQSVINKEGRVPWNYVLDELADHFGMSEQEMIDSIEQPQANRVQLDRAKTGLAALIEQIQETKSQLAEMTAQAREAVRVSSTEITEKPVLPGQVPMIEGAGFRKATKGEPSKPKPGQMRLVPEAETAARRFADKYGIDIVDNSVLDFFGTVFLESGDIEVATTAIPHRGKLDPEYAAYLGIHVYKDADGNTKIGATDTTFIPKEVADLMGDLRDIGYVSGKWQATGTMFKDMDGGWAMGVEGHPGILQKFVQVPAQHADMASYRWLADKTTRYQQIADYYKVPHNYVTSSLYKDILEMVTTEDAMVRDVDGVWDKVSETIADYSSANKDIKVLTYVEGMIKTAIEHRILLNQMIDEVNLVRENTGKKRIGYIEGYVPQMITNSIWAKLFGYQDNLKEKLVGRERPPVADFIKPDAPFNPHAKAREHGIPEWLQETNMAKIFSRYSDAMAKDIFNTPIIDNTKMWTKFLRESGFGNNARLIEDWVLESYAGMHTQLERGIRGIVPRKGLVAGSWVRQRLNAAVFSVNIPWNTCVQPSSIGFTYLRYGSENVIRGLDYIFSRDARNYVEKQYSYHVKVQRRASVVYEGLQDVQKRVRMGEEGKLETVEKYATFLTTQIEKLLTGISVRAGYHRGRQLKLTGTALNHYASEGGARTQSMYNLEDQPGVLRTRTVGMLAPFQTFAIEAFNTVREVAGLAGETHLAPTWQRRLRMVAEFMAVITVINMVADRLIDRKPWQLSSFIPFFSIQMGGIDATNKWNNPLPIRYTGDFWDGLMGIIKYGNLTKMRKFLIAYHVPTGTQTNRVLTALEAYLQRGSVKDVTGREIFRFDTDDFFNVMRAFISGVYTTEEGRERKEESMKGRGGAFYEWTGLPIPSSFFWQE